MHLFLKSLLQNNLWKWNFSQMKNFFDLSKRSDIFGFVKEKYNFCTKNYNSKYLQNTKKIFTPWKNSKSQLSNDIRFSTQTQGMTKIWSKQKKLHRGGIFFVPNCIYTPNQKKMLPPSNTFFSFEHISVIPWVWMENLISMES